MQHSSGIRRLRIVNKIQDRMKKILSILLVLVVISSSAFARRATDKPVPVSGLAVMKNGSTFKVFYKGANASDIKVSILDADNNIVFVETIRKVESFVRPYNFENLAKGEYTIEVSDAALRQTQKVQYGEPSDRMVGLVRLATEESAFLLTVPNKGDETLQITIRGEEGELLYSGQEKVQGDFARIYKLRDATGAFSFEVSDSKGIVRTVRN